MGEFIKQKNFRETDKRIYTKKFQRNELRKQTLKKFRETDKRIDTKKFQRNTP